ncbi:hypothetical protein D9M73_72630 [compost metagenome]|jgi:hypothetical protein|uniref:hypothetical protein n=1 Tax=Sphingomonas sp. PL20 TaxID=2760712 RepID=UPI001AE7F170
MGEPVAIGPLAVRQSIIDASWRPERKYDLFFTALSWETRGTTFLEQSAEHLPPVTILRFASSDQKIDDAKDACLAKVRAQGEISEIVRLQTSTSLLDNYKIIEALLRDRASKTARPLRVLVDISCIPKAYVMFFVGAGFSRDYLAVMDCVYVAGTYDHTDADVAKSTSANGNRTLVSAGDWRPELIPYLKAAELMPASNDLLVALGGELGMARSFMDRIEPDRTMLIFIAEDAPGPERDMVPSERIAFKHLVSDTQSQTREISLGDVIGVAEQAISFVRSSNCGGVSGMALGAKSHALALAIASLSESRLEVVVRVPTSYKGLDVRPSGPIHLFELSDRFEPCSYIET